MERAALRLHLDKPIAEGAQLVEAGCRVADPDIFAS
jgi:hypothetical protein